MADNTTKEALAEPDSYDGEHTVTATEPAWVEQDHQPNEHGTPEPVNETTTTGLIDSLSSESTYECSCGVELSDWSEVTLHFAVVTETEDDT